MDETGNNTGDSTPMAPPTTSPVVPPIASANGASDAPPAGSMIEQPIVAGPGQYYRNTRYIMAALTVVMGFWFGYDGFVRWPAEVATIQKIKSQQDSARASGDDVTVARLGTEMKNYSNHSDMDILLQRILAFSLPPLGICLLLWALHNSRGQYRLADEILFVPGHPPVPLAAIRELDQSAWDRKGIAKVGYELPDGRAGKAKLDDFVYDRAPTDLIYDRVKAHLQPPAEIPSQSDSSVENVAQGPNPEAH